MAGRRSKIRVVGVTALLVALGTSLAALWWSRVTPLDRSRAAYDRGDYREARSIIVGLLAIAPDDRDAVRLMARASARLADDDSAQRLYGFLGESAMEAEDFFVLGAGLDRRGDVPSAIAVLERSRKLDPDHAETLQILARLYARSDRLPEAIGAAERLAGRPGWESRGSLILGVLNSEHADPDRAASNLDRAIRVDPELIGGITTPAEARKLLAGAWLRTSHPDRALETLRPLLAVGTDLEASWLSGRAYLQGRDAARASAALANSGDFRMLDPTLAEPAAYGGAKACAGCHASIYDTQRSSRHARTFASPTDLKNLRLPDGPIPDPALSSTTHSLAHEGDTIRLTTRSQGRELSAVVEYALGSGDRGLTMVARDAAGVGRVCRVSSYRGGALWDQTSHIAEPDPADLGGPLGRPMTRGAEEKCRDCHLTSLRAARDPRALGAPEALDRGIACERCHGPGGNHLIATSLNFPDPAIARPSKASADRINKLCGNCHQVDDPSTTEADPRFVRFQATTFPRSRCYTESRGAISCVTCHDPHRDAEKDPARYEAKCLACHSTQADGPSESRKLGEGIRRVPCPVNPASGCLNCHMPKVEGAAPHATFTDHQIRTHKVPAGR